MEPVFGLFTTRFKFLKLASVGREFKYYKQTWFISSTHLNGTVVRACRASIYIAVATLLSPPL